MALELGEVVATFDGGDAEVVYDSTGPFETVQTNTLVPVASFTLPRGGYVVATMWFIPGSITTGSNVRGMAVEVGGSRIEAQLTYAAETHILSCRGGLPAGEATILVKSHNTYSASTTTPTRFRVITWSE